jgi:hypothetical protein
VSDEYEEVKGLQEILEELAACCALRYGVKDPKITVILPKKVMERYNSEMMSRYATVKKVPTPVVTHLNVNGVVELLSDEYEAVRKRDSLG